MNPYQALPSRSFWRTAVAEPQLFALRDLWAPRQPIGPDDAILTAGSCFAGHLGRALRDRGLRWCEVELPPPGLTPQERRSRRFGEYSFRTGAIYTTALLRQWLAWAFGEAKPPTDTWVESGRHIDPWRPSIEPDGFDSAEAVHAARETTLAAMRAGIEQARWFVFTLGLTEAWLDGRDGTVYPSCPGTVAGTFDADRHVLHTLTVAQVHDDLVAAIAMLRAANPQLRIVLTVSPVPLTATATGSHVLVANTYSKSVLRAAAGQLAQEREYVEYFPAYELIASAPSRAVFFEPNLRSVSAAGVDFVMRHFFAALAVPATRPPATPEIDGGDIDCDDAVLDYYGPAGPG